ncbi:MAG: cation:proton antiporter [Candidatus Aenigmarchaeota archaeon]|nr:cation:proton antiporter [Candidatus Aenigmarchaeota archaeon]
MALDPLTLLFLFAATIIIGYFGLLVFEKTRISDIIWLVLFGMLVGPVLHFVDSTLFAAIAPVIATIALLLILFEAGLNMEFYRLVRGFGRSMALAIACTAFSILAVGVVSTYLLNFSLLQGMLLGAILGGTSSPIVITIVHGLRLPERTKTLLNLESILTDPLVVIVAITIINFINQAGQVSATQGILAAFSIGAVIGGLAGIAWLFALDRLKGRQFDYMLTLAVLFLIYAFAESNGGSGAIAALVFGLVLGNSTTFSSMLRFRKRFTVDSTFKAFQAEISFFIRSFFFVFLGIIFTVSQEFIVYGLVIAAVLVLVRIAAVRLATLGNGFSALETNVIRVMAPRGLAAAVLAQYPLIFGIPDAGVFVGVVSVALMATVVYTTIAIRIVTGSAPAGKAIAKRAEGI